MKPDCTNTTGIAKMPGPKIWFTKYTNEPNDPIVLAPKDSDMGRKGEGGVDIFGP